MGGNNDNVPGFGIDRTLIFLSFVADVTGILAYLGFQPKHLQPAVPVFVLAACAAAIAGVILVRQVRFFVSFDSSDFPPSYLRAQIVKASVILAVAAATAIVAAVRLD